MMEEEKVIHDRECQTCKKLFTCEGKPADVKRCVNYKERKDRV